MTAGHNNPPADAAFSMEIDDLFQTLSDSLAGGDVANDAQEAAIAALLDDFRKASADADKARKAAAKPFDDGKKAVQALWTPIIAKADRGTQACKDALMPYRTAKQKAIQDAADKARKEAEVRAREATAALRAADDLDAKFAAEMELEAAQKLQAAVKRVEAAPTGLRTSYEAEIADKGLALRHYLKRDPDAFLELIQKLADHDARNEATRRDIPGVVFHKRERAA